MKFMSKEFQGMRKAQAREMLPAIDLFPQVEYVRRKIDAAIFGSNNYNNNIAEMQKIYWHSVELPSVTFRPLSTAESIAVVAYDFENLAKPRIFDNSWLQAGRVLRTQDGVYVNLPKDKESRLIDDEKALKQYLRACVIR